MLYILDQNQQTADLSKELITFGLNPQDWNLVRERTSEYRIESKEDQDFIFKGKVSTKGKWEQLELMSI
jgi:hypothetical protein